MQAEICKAIAHPTRIHILQLLRDGERCVCEIFPAMEMEQPNVSRHLAILKKAGIISSRKEGLKVIYRVNDKRIFELLDLITAILKEQIDSRKKILT
ncbi:MAG TPA: ArsR family transcriptional regulator [Firmicutes bacterium]|nr:ArsR family transcriptional regulator [Bacillota bacterium]